MSQNIPISPVPALDDVRVSVIAAEWNAEVTDRLLASAVDTLRRYGLTSEDIDVFRVPGTIELTFAASQVIEASIADAVIVIGCVERGDTPHFDYVCQSVTQGVTALNADCDVPVIFCVLTVDTHQQALDRCGGPAGDKGIEAAEAALKMVGFKRLVESM